MGKQTVELKEKVREVGIWNLQAVKAKGKIILIFTLIFTLFKVYNDKLRQNKIKATFW